jgi:NitT/TauT family transport system permease protein
MVTAIDPGTRGEGAARPARAAARPWPRFAWNVESIAVVAALLVAWQAASAALPPLFFPSLPRIAAALADLVRSPDDLAAVGITYARIIIFTGVAFGLATALGIVAGVNVRVERAALPLVRLMQAVPAVCWVIFAILWFKDMDVRIGFVVVVSSIPVFFYQARDGVRAISPDLWSMMRAWRPTPAQLFRKLIWPALAPAMITGWRINLGNGTRITITAELLGGISGIGYALRNAQEQFQMDQAIAWTIALVAFVLVSEAVVGRVERHVLRWRPRREPA